MYESYYELKEKPFRIVADPGYLYFSQGHKRALTFLEYGLMEDAGIVLMTGDAGSGKTTLVRFILLTLKQTGKDILPAVIYNVNFSGGAEMVATVLHSFGLAPEKIKSQSIEKLSAFLHDKEREKKRVWLIIDEAQNLSREALEEVRLFSNLQSDKASLLHIMLVGQPELRARLMQPNLSSFSQRIAVHYHIGPLSAVEVGQYIAHRLDKAGGKVEIFDRDSVESIARASGGIPRTINLLCDAAMAYGFGYELDKIGRDVIEQVIEDKGGMGLAEGLYLKAAAEEALRTCGGNDNGLHGRMDVLETRFAQLQKVLNARMAELDRRVDDSRKELICRLQELLFAERKRSDSLLVRYTALRAKDRK
jgi:general secretion pathway protein A